MTEHSTHDQFSKLREGNIILENPSAPVAGKRSSSAKSRKEAALPPKDAMNTGDTGNEAINMKARKRTKTGCLSKHWP